jgi:chemotaxis protein MotB
MKLNRLMAVMMPILLLSCVSSKQYKLLQGRYNSLDSTNSGLRSDLKGCEDLNAEAGRQKSLADAQIQKLNEQIAFLKENNTTVVNQLKDLSVISGSQAESIKKSLDNIGAKDAYIQDLQKSLARKDSLNMALVMNLKGAVGNMQDEDINIKVDKGVVYIDISDKMLFKSGSYDITDRAKEVLGKVALVVKNQPDIEFMVEGHTDNVAFKKGVLLDNWDLSVKRATAVVRVLQNQYGLDPARMAAAGRSEYKPVASNDTPDGKAANRRTRIIILPQLDQFFKLLEHKES